MFYFVLCQTNVDICIKLDILKISQFNKTIHKELCVYIIIKQNNKAQLVHHSLFSIFFTLD